MPPKPRSAQQEQQGSSSEDTDGAISELREIKSTVYPLALKVHQIDDKVSELKKDVDSQLSSINTKVDAIEKNIDSKLAEAVAEITKAIKKSLEPITGVTATKSDGMKKDIDSKLAETVSKINGVTDGMKKDIDSKLINITSKVDKIDSEVAKLGAVSDATNRSITLLEALDVKGPRMGNFFCHWDVGDLHHVFEIKLFDDRSPEAVNWFRRLNFSSLRYQPVGYTGSAGDSSFDFRIDFDGLAENDWFRHFGADSSELQRRHDAVKAFSDVDNLVLIHKGPGSNLLFFKITQYVTYAYTALDFVVIGQVVNYSKESLHKDGMIASRAGSGPRSEVSKDRPFQWY